MDNPLNLAADSWDQAQLATAPANSNTGNESAFTLGSFVGDLFKTVDTVAPAYFQARAIEAAAGTKNAARPTSLGFGAGSATIAGIPSGYILLAGIALVALLLWKK